MNDTKYREAIDLLDFQYAHFVTHVLNIGSPMTDNTIPTAAVAIQTKEKDHSKFQFLFNYDFAESLNVEEYAFILAHETLHVLLNHLKLARKFQDKMRFNIAADCVINDYLGNCGLVSPEGLMTGIENVGYNCANATVSQVYDDLPESVVMQGGIGIQIDDHTWIHIPEGALADKIEKILEDAAGGIMPGDLQDIKDDLDSKTGITRMFKGGQKAGSSVGAATAFTENTGVSLNWAKLLQEIDPDALNDWKGNPLRPSYHRKPRKLAGFQDLYLPVQRRNERSGFGERKLVFMALDTSGSIGPQTANYFVNLARSVAKTRIKLHAITFTTRALTLDLENPSFEGGGTAFGCIQRYIENKVMPENKNRYPNSVVVITDGCAGFHDFHKPESKHYDRWLWLMVSGYRNQQRFGKEENLSKYTSK